MHLNFFLLGSYDVLIGMDWLEQHKAKVYCFNKVVECVDGKGMPIEVRKIIQPIFVWHILALQLQRLFKKGCQVYAICISKPTEHKGLSLKDYKVSQEYVDAFLEVLGLPLNKVTNFTIDLVPRVVQVSKVPYLMSTP